MNHLECNCQWHFAEQPYASQDIGPNNAAAEHFIATPYPSLIRESIQNSLDVAADASQPVRMRFEFGKLRSKTYEGFYELKKHIEGVIKLYGAKAEKEYAPMLKHFELSFSGHGELYYIKVSDYNTKGMDFKKDDTNSPFYAFMRALGVTAKDDDSSGGSFGFGKSAYFLMSPIHTVLVSTMTETGKTFFEGAARLCTHLYKNKDGKEIKFQHYGYYDNQNGIQPASLQTDIPNKFKRDETGTDIYIMGVDGDEAKQAEAIDEMVKSTLRNFWMAILQQKLIVEISDITIDDSTLDDLMQSNFQDTIDKIKNGDNYNPRPYYEAVKNANTSKEFIRLDRQLPLLGNVSLFLWKNKEARDGVVHMRKQRMFIFRYRKYSSSYGYYAVFICTDNHGNKLLQSIEDPSHRKWEPRRNRTMGRSIMDEIDSFIADSLQEIFSNDNDGPLGVTGLEDYLFVPEELVASEKDDVEDNPFFGEPSEDVQDEGTSPVSQIDSSEPISTPIRKEALGKVITTTPPLGGERMSEGPLGGHQRGEGKKKRKGAGNSPDKSAFTPNDTEAPGEFLQNIPVRYRVMAENKNGTLIHSIILKSDFDVERGQIEIVVDGEENDEIIDIVASSIGLPEGNVVSNLKIYKGIPTIVELQFDDSMKHAIKLTAYEFK